jgi:hypothetical protein
VTHTPASQIQLARTSPNDVQNRQVYINLDGNPLATLLYGRSVTKPIGPGEHVLVANNTWKRRKLYFTVAAGEQVAFQIVSRPGWGYNLLVGFFGAAPMEVDIVPVPFETPAPADATSSTTQASST